MMAILLITLMSQLPLGAFTLISCLPNEKFISKGRLCICNSSGMYSDEDCAAVNQKVTCQPGQVIWQGCSQCICQENSELICTYDICFEESTAAVTPSHMRMGFSSLGSLCTPFKSYYVECHLCVCTASGITNDAHCAKDTSCTLRGDLTKEMVMTSKRVCLPRVMYLFSCLHCLCSDDGFLREDKCIETCSKPKQTYVDILSQCVPDTLYRRGCNICVCPKDGYPSEKLCTKSRCADTVKFNTLVYLRNKHKKCSPHTFTKNKCFYCDCLPNGQVDEMSCLEQDCLHLSSVSYGINRNSCNPGEMLALCEECFCPRNGMINETYCTTTCNYQSKLAVLDKMVIESGKHLNLIDRKAFKQVTQDQCTPNTVYIDQGRFCICPINGNTNFKFCTRVLDRFKPARDNFKPADKIVIDYNVTCEPSTFLEFDCNTCFCNKQGKIDPSWCTYDDCEAKRIIQESHKTQGLTASPAPELSGTCSPGSLTKVDCNICICPESGARKDRACTKNKCSGLEQQIHHEKFSCEPLSYYEVDCNICSCPRDGLKNLAKCTKDLCEKSFLRSDFCVPGQLFSDECNICVCPPNGDKIDKACTNHTCPDAIDAWKKIFKLSQTLLTKQVPDDKTGSLDLCFPGEEFLVGCSLCVCPEMGLRSYASCSQIICPERRSYSSNQDRIANTRKRKHFQRNRRQFKVVDYDEKEDTRALKNCSAGSMYIINCKQCICPYSGTIDMKYCRELAPGTYCEQPYPGFDYLITRRRGHSLNPLDLSNKSSNIDINEEKLKKETKYSCTEQGKIMDECYICDCEDNVIVVEKCFVNEADHCKDKAPTFLNENNKIIQT